MKNSISLLLALVVSLAGVASLRAQSTAFTYQGRLNTSAGPATGAHDFQFTLFSASTGGSPVLSSLVHSAVAVTNGLFSVALNFGADIFTGAALWLDIAVRPSIGGTFTTLTPRQSITPTPYALNARTAQTALSVPGISGHALHAQDASPDNAVFVDTVGKVGVGTTSPQEKLDVRSGDGSYVRVDIANGDIKANGGSDGHFGLFNDHTNTSGGTHLIGQGQSRLFVQNNGNVGIGTTTPQAHLDVRGDVRLGPNGELQATGGTENLRIVRGAVTATGAVTAGSGFSVGVSQVSDTLYTLIFDPPFSGTPIVTATAERMPGLLLWAGLDGVNHGTANVLLWDPSRPGFSVEGSFHFIAIGPR